MAATAFSYGSLRYTVAVESTWEQAIAAHDRPVKMRIETNTANTGLVNGTLQWYVGDSAPGGGAFWHSIVGTAVTAGTTSAPSFAEVIVPAGHALYVKSLTTGGTPNVSICVQPCPDLE